MRSHETALAGFIARDSALRYCLAVVIEGQRTFAVGDVFTCSRCCDELRSIFYAAAGGDFNKIHIDDDAGRRAGHGGRILHGLCTLAWAVEAVRGHVGAGAVVTRVRARFTAPVRAGDVITFAGSIVAREGDRLSTRVAARNQRGESVLKGAIVDVRLP